MTSQHASRATETVIQSDLRQLLTFVVGEERLAVDVLHVREVRSFERPTFLPRSPDFILGVINLRGIIVPVLDMRIRFKCAHSYGLQTVVIVVSVRISHVNRTVGLVVDALADVIDVQPNTVKSLPYSESEEDEQLFEGLVRQDEGLIGVLDLEKLLRWPESSPSLSVSQSGAPHPDKPR